MHFIASHQKRKRQFVLRKISEDTFYLLIPIEFCKGKGNCIILNISYIIRFLQLKGKIACSDNTVDNIVVFLQAFKSTKPSAKAKSCLKYFIVY